MTEDELDRCMETYMAAWPHTKVLPETLDLAETLIQPLPFEAVMGALAQFSLEGREFAPPLGLLARRAVELVGEANGYHAPDPEEALREVYRTISAVGIYRTPEWSDSAIASAIDALGGWKAVCNEDNPEAFRAHFLKLYGTARTRVDREALLGPSVRELAGGLNLRADRELTP